MLPDPVNEPTLDVERAGTLFGLGRTKAYVEARRYVDNVEKLLDEGLSADEARDRAEGLPAIATWRLTSVPDCAASRAPRRRCRSALQREWRRT